MATLKLEPFKRFDFILALVAVEHALSGLVPLSNLLQKKECDLYVAVEESRVVIRQLNGERNDPEVWNALYDSAVELAATIGVLPSMPRNRAGQQNRPNVPADNPSTYWKLNMYLPFVDHLMAELDTRLLTAQPRYKAQYLLPKKAAELTQVLVNLIYDSYEDELTMVTRDKFHAETRRWRAKWTGQENQPNDLQGTLNKQGPVSWDFPHPEHFCLHARVNSHGQTLVQYYAESKDLPPEYYDNKKNVWPWPSEYLQRKRNSGRTRVGHIQQKKGTKVGIDISRLICMRNYNFSGIGTMLH